MNRINRIRQKLFSVRHLYSNPLDAQRAQVLLIVNVVIVVLSVLTTLLLLLPNILATGTVDIAGIGSTILVIAAAVISHRFIQSGRLNVATWIILAAITLGTLSGIVVSNDGLPSVSTSIIVFLPVPIVAAGVLLNRRGLFAITVVVVLVVVGTALAQRSNFTPVTYIPADRAISDLTMIIAGIFSVIAILVAFLSTLQRIANESYQSASQHQWIRKLGIELSAINDEATLLNTALGRTRQALGQRFVEIYLINEDGNLILASGSTQRRKTIRSIDANILAETARSRTLLVTSLQEPPERHTHMAASTSFAAAVPIIVNDNLMAVLDFQDVVPFTQNELDGLQELADQLALSLQRVRITHDLKSRVDDHELTITRLQTQLQDFNRRQQQSVSEIWGGYIQGRGKQAIGYNLDGDSATPIQASDLPSDLVNTLKSGQLEVTTQGSEQIVNVPIRFRDTNLGAMSFAVPADHPLNDRQIEVATIVAERLALALENTRLFEQSQSQAFRERKAGEVATALIGATDVRVVLNMAAEQFKEALGAVNTRIYIRPETMMEPLAETQQEQ